MKFSEKSRSHFRAVFRTDPFFEKSKNNFCSHSVDFRNKDFFHFARSSLQPRFGENKIPFQTTVSDKTTGFAKEDYYPKATKHLKNSSKLTK